ncbi:MAG: hypothetical protein AB1551_06170 [Actinomycetota bacterium]
MRRAVAITALIAVILVGSPPVSQGHQASTRPRHLEAAAAENANRFRPCTKPRMMNIRPKMTHETVVRRVSAIIRCAERRWPVPGGVEKALEVAECESSFAPWADDGHGDLGVYQISEWRKRAREWLRPRMFPRWQRPFPGWANARANVLLGIRWAHVKGWGAWTCA